jgi:hypothetical protein
MRFLADEGIDRSIVHGLRLSGFDVFYVVEQTRSVNDDILLEIDLTISGGFVKYFLSHPKGIDTNQVNIFSNAGSNNRNL